MTTETKIDKNTKCWRCEKYIGVELTRPWKIICSRCKAMNKSPNKESCGTKD